MAAGSARGQWDPLRALRREPVRPAQDLHRVVVVPDGPHHLLDALAVHRPPGQVPEPTQRGKTWILF